jgi:hypothetical protein
MTLEKRDFFAVKKLENQLLSNINLLKGYINQQAKAT